MNFLGRRPGQNHRHHAAAARLLRVAWTTPGDGPRSGTRIVAAYAVAALLPAALTVVVVRLAPTWPRPYSWQYLGIALGAALSGGVGPGLVALSVGTAAILWLGVPTPVHPGAEMFVATGVTLLIVVARFRATQRDLRERAAVLRSVIDAIPDPVFVATHDAVTLSNVKTVRFCGVATEAELPGTVGELAERLALRAPADGHPLRGAGLPIARALAGETAVAEVLARDAETGTDALLRSACAPIVDRGTIIGAVSVNSDVTRLKKTEQERNRAEQAFAEATKSAERALAAANRANATKDHFLSIISHELRTPLAAMLAGVELLKRDTALQERSRPVIDMLRRKIEEESRLVNNLLDVTHIAQGDLPLEKRPINVVDVLNRAIAACSADLSLQQLELAVETAPGIPAIEGDRDRLEQAFWNLLKNAAKFTPAGGRVHVRCTADPWAVCIAIDDTGVGISAGDLSSIFDPFAQAERTLARRFGGAGIGLTIARWAVEQHGGTIEARSDGPGRGSTFTVRLPVSTALRGAPALDC